MDPTSPDLEARVRAVERARMLLSDADRELAAIRQRARGVSAQMAWTSPAADAFRDAVADWEGLLARVDAQLAQWDDELVRLRGRLVSAGAAG